MEVLVTMGAMGAVAVLLVFIRSRFRRWRWGRNTQISDLRKEVDRTCKSVIGRITSDTREVVALAARDVLAAVGLAAPDFSVPAMLGGTAADFRGHASLLRVSGIEDVRQMSAPVGHPAGAMTSIRSVHIILLNWNGRDDTLACLASLRQLDYPNYSVVVVDNGSTDGSVAAIKEAFPSVTLLETGSNLGYAGGNNVGIKRALENGADYIWLLNNDTVIAPDSLSELVEAARKLPPKTILGSAIYFHDEPNKVWFLGGRWIEDELTFGHYDFRGTAALVDKDIFEVDYVTGCSLFTAAQTYRDIGLLDHQYFLYFEEVDLCCRALDRGYRCVVARRSKLWHKVSSSMGGEASPLWSYFYSRNRLLWAGRYLPLAKRLRLHAESVRDMVRTVMPPLRLTDGSSPVARRFLWSLRHWWSALARNLADPMGRARRMGLRDYYLGRFGDCPRAIRDLRQRPAASEH